MLASGFTNAPVSKFLLVYVIASSIALAIFDVKHLAHIQVSPHLWRYGQPSRLLVWQVAGYANSTEALFAAMLVYHLRVVERMWGGRKMATFLLTTLPYTTLLPPILLALVARPLSLNTLNYLPSGPTATVFALLAQYHAAVPHTFKYRISTTSNPSDSKPSLTLLLSDKSTTYLVAAQLALSQFPATLLPAAVGWFVGAAWRAEMLPGSSRFVSGARGGWRIPAWIVGEKERITTTAAAARRGQDDGGERYEDLRRRLEDESRAAAASSGVGGVEGEHQRQRRTQGGAGIFERFRGAF